MLAAFDAALVPGACRSAASSWRAIAAGVTGLLAVALTIGLVAWPSRPIPPGEGSTPIAVVSAGVGARWSRHLAAGVERIVLESGELSIRVDRRRSERRLLVNLPDGELEDIGTTFSVSVSEGQTVRIAVRDGSVVLRRPGRAQIILGAGESWSQPPKPRPLPPAPLEPAPLAASASGASAIPAAPSSRSQEPFAASEFRAAMSAFDAGDNARAAALFARFVARHPRDARTEDAAYLRVLSLQRAGDTAAMRRAAREYLTRFPRAFRQVEVERLAE